MRRALLLLSFLVLAFAPRASAQAADEIRATGTMRSITHVAGQVVEDIVHDFVAVASDGDTDSFAVHFVSDFWAPGNPMCTASAEIDGCRFGGDVMMGDVVVGTSDELTDEGVGSYTDPSVAQQFSAFSINPSMVSCAVGTVSANAELTGPFAMVMHAITIDTYVSGGVDVLAAGDRPVVVAQGAAIPTPITGAGTAFAAGVGAISAAVGLTALARRGWP